MSELCFHKTLDKDKFVTFCNLCGCLVSSGITSIKPTKYNHIVEFHPLETIRIIQSNPRNINIKSPNFLEYLPKRTDLIKYMRQIVKRNYLKEQTFSLAILLMDIILTNFKDLKHDLVAVTCILLSCKFDEDDPIIPDLTDFQTKDSKLYFSTKEILQNEVTCLKLLDYKVNYFTAFYCLEILLSYGIFFEKEIPYMNLKISISLIEKVETAYQLCYNILNFFISSFLDFTLIFLLGSKSKSSIFTKFMFM